MRNKFQEFCLGKTLEEIYGKERAQEIKEKGMGEKNHFYGKHHKKKSRQLLRNAFLGEKGYWFGQKLPKHSEEMKGDKNPMKKVGVKEKHKLVMNKPENREKRRIFMVNYIKNTFGNFFVNIGKHEQQILDELQLSINKKIVRQYAVRGYICDGYIPDLNLIIEVDEEFHNGYKERDLIRQKEIVKKLKCNFIRIPDYIEINS